MEPDPAKHRRSIRVPVFDYSSPGAYFITVVTRGRQCLFGEIQEAEMRLSAMGQIAAENWRAIPEHFHDVELGAWVVMPNHLHGIILLNGDGRGTNSGRGTIYRAPTKEQFQKPVSGSIPTIVRTYKASVTRRIGRVLNEANIWQRNYYEHIIRDDEEWNRIHLYIEANIDGWALDDENPLRAQ